MYYTLIDLVYFILFMCVCSKIGWSTKEIDDDNSNNASSPQVIHVSDR